ncbi:MAG: flap endonuclease Xni [Ferrimonas sp.]
MTKLLLIDALNLIRRIHATLPSDDNEALLNRCQQALRKAQLAHQPSHAILVWDGEPQQSWRRQLYPEYKAHRKPMPAHLAAQLGNIAELFAQHGVYSIKQAQFEADDLIATLATKTAQHGGQALILSTDRGFCQLHSNAITQWDHFQNAAINAQQVAQKLAINTDQLLDYWALAGDTNNGIPGVPGIGAKSAAELLSRYSHLNQLFAELPQTKQGMRLAEHKALARLSYQLVKLKCNLELNLNLNQFRIQEKR